MSETWCCSEPWAAVLQAVGCPYRPCVPPLWSGTMISGDCTSKACYIKTRQEICFGALTGSSVSLVRQLEHVRSFTLLPRTEQIMLPAVLQESSIYRISLNPKTASSKTRHFSPTAFPLPKLTLLDKKILQRWKLTQGR